MRVPHVRRLNAPSGSGQAMQVFSGAMRCIRRAQDVMVLRLMQYVAVLRVILSIR